MFCASPRLDALSPTTPRCAGTRAQCWMLSGTRSLRMSSPPAPRTRRVSFPKVRIWEIPNDGLKKNMTEAVLELYGHSRRVGIIEWHPTANNILFSSGYDYKILIWNLDDGEAVKMIDCHTDVILCMSFNTDGSLLATTCKDKKLRVLEPRSGRVLQAATCKNHKMTRVVFLGNMKRLLTTGVSKWNTRQIALWDQVGMAVLVVCAAKGI
ncbi:hypothetical protein AB205_0159380 [Aquarana catesbeiana]|uniref:Coronin n=1 Tax=Aquarana catesbeiana TaxID=8400 RepID=A0A2G9RUP7_AQUCT|nr:hypothetical protein AB205_0159380 [Aquarana catesbeiana]PIO31628.1 hypothetical protein AB205_0159380 [Aquarana catesbeiana]